MKLQIKELVVQSLVIKLQNVLKMYYLIINVFFFKTIKCYI